MLGSPFVAYGLYAIFFSSSDTFSLIVSWFCVVFFGLTIPIGLYTLLDWRPQIIINEVGIFDRTILKDFINWELIEDVYLVDTGKKFICIVLKANTDLTSYHTKLFKKITSLNKAFGFQELNINLAFIKIDAQRLTDFVKQMSNSNVVQRKTLILDWH